MIFRGNLGLIRPLFFVSFIAVISTMSGKPLLYNRKKEGNEARCYPTMLAPFQRTGKNKLIFSLNIRWQRLDFLLQQRAHHGRKRDISRVKKDI
jgi:hypothetical protein